MEEWLVSRQEMTWQERQRTCMPEVPVLLWKWRLMCFDFKILCQIGAIRRCNKG